MMTLSNGFKDIAASKAGKELTMEDIKDIIDIDKDKKITWKDIKIWVILIGQALLLGFLLSLYYNYDSIYSFITGEEGLNGGALIQQLIVSAIAFTYKASKQSASNKIKTEEAKNLLLTQTVLDRDLIISNNTKKTEEVINAYENQLFLFEADLVGKTKASMTKDQIARILISKYDELKAVFAKIRPLPNIDDLNNDDLNKIKETQLE